MADCPFCSEPIASLPKPGLHAVLIACRACMNPVRLGCDGAEWTPGPVKGFQDVRQVAEAGSIGSELLKILPDAMERLPILPEVAQRILKMTDDPDHFFPAISPTLFDRTKSLR